MNNERNEMSETQTVMTHGGKPEFKAAFLAEIGQHEQMDALVKGDYGHLNGTFKGCAIGCAVFSLHRLQGNPPTKSTQFRNHEKVATDLGWPLWLAYLEDNVFEMLPTKLSKTWPRRLAEAVPVGAVITDEVLAKILVWSLTAERFGVINATDKPDAKVWITTIADYITADAAGTATDEQKAAAEGAARAAWAAWAAWAEGDAWAAWAARAARAAWAARAAETRDAYYPALSDYVLSVLRELPVKVDESIDRRGGRVRADMVSADAPEAGR